MPVPVLENGPWTFSVNHDCSEVSNNETCRHAVWQVKESLVTFSAWSVVASSDYSAVKNIGDASPDLWVAWASDIVGASAGNPHSWIVLENNVTGEQLCIDARHANLYQMDWVYSPTGTFAADGTTSNRPTDTDSIVIMPYTSVWGQQANNAVMVVHVMISNDNKCTRIFCHQKGYPSALAEGTFLVALEEAYDPPSQWTSTYKRSCLQYWAGTYTSTTISLKDPSLQRLDHASAMNAYLQDATPYSGWNTSRFTGEVYNFGPLATTGFLLSKNNADQTWAGGYPLSKLGMYRPAATRGGPLGRWKDIYFAQYTHDTYDTYPDTGTREWIKFGALLVPWNGSTPEQP